MSLPALFVRLVAYRLSLLLTVVIFVLCLYDLPETPLDQVHFIDKYTHVLMYLAYGIVLWVETGLRDLPPHKRWSVCVAWPVAMGGASKCSSRSARYTATATSSMWRPTA